MTAGVETLQFQADTSQLLRLMVHSIYSDKDIFLRELVSNASDALDKLRLFALVNQDLQIDTSDLQISIQTDPVQRTLTVRDNGIGMSREEVVDLIGTIGRSDTAALLEKWKAAKDAPSGPELIGQFGVGFYSTFMVADKVTLLTRRAEEAEATRWTSDGEGAHTVESVRDAPRGTAVTLHLKSEDPEEHLYDYTSVLKIKEIVKRYSDFISWPITLTVKQTDDEVEPTREAQTINSMKALWARARATRLPMTSTTSSTGI
jgi:molecular chaperone HtpG